MFLYVIFESVLPMLLTAGNYIVGKYTNEADAAIAYNKTVDTLWTNGFTKKYSKNFISDMTKEEYLKRYSSIRISDSIISARP